MPEQQALIPELLDLDDTPRDKFGRAFQLPNGGNGRPRGARTRKYQMLEALASRYSLELFQTTIRRALDGDMKAMAILADRIWPKPRTAPISVDLPPTETPGDLIAAMHQLLARVASGEISTDDGHALTAMLKDMLHAHSIETLLPDAAAPVANARELLRERLMRVLEQRRTLEAPADPPAAASATDPAIEIGPAE